jgi:hypothetical protein
MRRIAGRRSRLGRNRIQLINGLLALAFALATSVGFHSAWAGNVPGGTLLGKSEGKGRCAEGLGQVWVAQGKNLFFHAELPVRAGEFEFRLIPGKYQVTVTSRSGCMGEETIEILEGKTTRVLVKPISPM